MIAALGLVVCSSSKHSSSRARSIRSPRASTIEPWVNAVRFLWVDVTMPSAPRAIAWRRQGGVEAEVRAPGLVDDQRHAGGMAERGDRLDVGEPADVAGLDQEHRPRVGRRRPAPARPPRSGRPAPARWPASTSGRTHTGSRPASTRPACSDLCSVRATITLSPGRATASANAWLPCVEPLTENRHMSAAPERGGQPLGPAQHVARHPRVVGARRPAAGRAGAARRPARAIACARAR